MSGGGTLGHAYHESLRRHGYQPDVAQQHAVARLENLRNRLEAAHVNSGGWLGRLRRAGRRDAGTVRGLYLWGGVGRGKTFLMDLFHTQLTVPGRRQHFHRFMKDVHHRLGQLRERESPLTHVAAEIARDTRVLCLDELYVSDIADAMILAGLFAGLDAQGVTMVFTSNAPPAELYRDGLQRSRFLPAIELIERCTETVNVDAGHDYRLRQLEKAPLYLDSGDPFAEQSLALRFEEIAGEPGEPGGNLTVEGRDIPLRRRSMGVAWFDFEAICGGPRSAADYVEIARDFHTVFVSGIPVFAEGGNDPARRFVALVDEFYDRNVKLVLSAAAAPEALYRGGRLDFEFERTRSRLAEMQSHEYLARPHLG
jgi:cell division protein ZapE